MWFHDPLAGVILSPMPGYEAPVSAVLAGWAEAGVARVLCLVPDDQLRRHGQPDLVERMRRDGFDVLHLPIPDFGVPSDDQVRQALAWLDDAVERGIPVAVHCLGGRGRTGTVVACWLRARGMSADEALAAVRARRPGAVETPAQEQLVRDRP